MDKKFVVDIYTPTGHYLKTWADYLSVTTGLGVVGILPSHAPLVTNIEISKNAIFLIFMYLTCIILFVISFIINKYLPFLYEKRNRRSL